MDLYERMGAGHIQRDKEIDWKEVKECQSWLNGNSRALSRIFNVGEAGGPRSKFRCFNNTTTWVNHAPTMRCSGKIHKDPAPEGHPQSHPVTANMGITMPGSDILSRILEPIAMVQQTDEAQAT